MRLIGSKFVVDKKTGFLRQTGNYKNVGFLPCKKTKFLQAYEKSANMTTAAECVGVSKNTVLAHLNTDEKFKEMFEAVEERLADNLEAVSVAVALTPDQRGFNDRKLQLMARRPEKYANKVNVFHQNQQKLAGFTAKMQGYLEAEVIEPPKLIPNASKS